MVVIVADYSKLCPEYAQGPDTGCFKPANVNFLTKPSNARFHYFMTVSISFGWQSKYMISFSKSFLLKL